MGEHAGTQNSFTRVVKERGVVKGFAEDKLDKKTRGWRGISLESNPENDPSGKSVSVQNSWKHGGGEKEGRHFSEDSQNLSTNTASYRGFSENDEKVSPEEKSVSETSPPPSEDDYLEGPTTFEEDGLTIEYMPEGRE